MECSSKLCVCDEAPHFSGIVWDPKVGVKKIDMKDYSGKYLVLFFYPMDFSVVCPTEIWQFSELYDSFKALNCEVLGCSGDSQYVHMEYTSKPRDKGGLGPIKFPLIADVSHDIAKSYGACLCKGENKGLCARATYIIDKKGIVRHISMNDLPVGRNAEEVLRLVEAFETVDEKGEMCPAKWKKGDKSLKP